MALATNKLFILRQNRWRNKGDKIKNGTTEIGILKNEAQ